LEFRRLVATTLAAVFSLASRRRKRFLPSLAATTPLALAAAVFSLTGRRRAFLPAAPNDLLQTFLIQ
jgi:hypothetical protein